MPRTSFQPQLVELETRALPSLTGGQFLIPPASAFPNTDPVTAAARNGSQVVVWVSTGTTLLQAPHLVAQVFDSGGNPGALITIPGSTLKAPIRPAVAMDDFGNYVVAWQDTATTSANIHAARISFGGQVLVHPFLVASTTAKEFNPTVASTASGAFTVGWTREIHAAGSIIHQDVLLHRYSATGTSLGTASVASALNERNPDLASTRDGRLALAYQVGNDVYLRRYAATGSVIGTNAIATGSNAQINPSVAINELSNIVVTWEERVGTDWNVYARRFLNGVLFPTMTVDAGTDREFNADVAIDLGGNFVIAYQSRNVSTNFIFAREYDLSGNLHATDNLGVASPTANPRISLNAGERFLIVFTVVRTFADPSNPFSFSTGPFAVNTVVGQFGQLLP